MLKLRLSSLPKAHAHGKTCGFARHPLGIENALHEQQLPLRKQAKE
jgi:hypothetical protein